MRTKSLQLIGLIALAAAALYGQPTNGPVYWSTTQPDCSLLSDINGQPETPVAITNSAGTTIGYSCYNAGTFVWLAAGGGWATSVRVAAPSSAPVGVDYSFYDTSGNPLSVDTTGPSASGNDVNFALSANQPVEVDLLGATSTAPNYSSTTVGSMYAIFFCPDAITCLNVLPQLIYSNLPSHPWSLSVPIAWDSLTWTQYSAEGVDDGGGHRVSLVVYNEDLTATSFKVSVYNSAGTLIGSGTTPSIPPLQNGGQGQGGTFGFQLSDVVKTPLPSGVFKILVDGGSIFSAVEVLQFTGPSATALQVGFDSAPTAAAPTVRIATARPTVLRLRVESAAKSMFRGVQK